MSAHTPITNFEFEIIACHESHGVIGQSKIFGYIFFVFIFILGLRDDASLHRNPPWYTASEGQKCPTFRYYGSKINSQTGMNTMPIDTNFFFFSNSPFRKNSFFLLSFELNSIMRHKKHTKRTPLLQEDSMTVESPICRYYTIHDLRG